MFWYTNNKLERVFYPLQKQIDVKSDRAKHYWSKNYARQKKNSSKSSVSITRLTYTVTYLTSSPVLYK